MSLARHPVPRDEWNLARYLARRGGLAPAEHIVHMGPGRFVLEAEGYGPYGPMQWGRARP